MYKAALLEHCEKNLTTELQEEKKAVAQVKKKPKGLIQCEKKMGGKKITLPGDKKPVIEKEQIQKKVVSLNWKVPKPLNLRK
jgi:hypothetical protein